MNENGYDFKEIERALDSSYDMAKRKRENRALRYHCLSIIRHPVGIFLAIYIPLQLAA